MCNAQFPLTIDDVHRGSLEEWNSSLYVHKAEIIFLKKAKEYRKQFLWDSCFSGSHRRWPKSDSWLVTHDSWLVRCCCYGKVSDSSGDDSSIKQGLISCHGSLLTAGKNLERLIVSPLQEDRWVWAVQGDVMWWVAWKEAFLSLPLTQEHNNRTSITLVTGYAESHLAI